MGDLFGVLLTVLLLGANAFFVGCGVRADLGAPRPARGAGRAGQEQRGHGDPGRREPVADAGGRAAGHHDLLDPAGPGRRTRRRAPAGEAVRSARHPRCGAAHGVVLRRAGDRRGAARAARRDGAEEHRDRRPGVDGDAAGPGVSGLDPDARPFIAFYNWCANIDAARRSGSRRKTNSTSRFRPSSCPR